MPIPAKISYSMPGAHKLPDNRVTWRPDPFRAALLIHDMQGYFLAPFERGGDPVTQLLGHCRLLRETATELAIPVIYTAQPGDMTSAERGLLYDFWGPGMESNPVDTRIVDELAPTEHDAVLTKWRYSGFHQTDLLDLLRASGRDQLLIAGVYAHVGCLITACQAFSLDIQPFLVADAVADFSADEHNLALRYAAARCAATPSTSRVVESLYSDSLATAEV